jgi:hypothetical protein
VRFSSYSWALVRHEVLPVSHGDARRHGCFYGILMESGKSVLDFGVDETRVTGKALGLGQTSGELLGDFSWLHVCQIGAADQAPFPTHKEK